MKNVKSLLWQRSALATGMTFVLVACGSQSGADGASTEDLDGGTPATGADAGSSSAPADATAAETGAIDGALTDAGASVDATVAADADTASDSAVAPDTAVPLDAGVVPDASDAGGALDSGAPADAGAPLDAGSCVGVQCNVQQNAVCVDGFTRRTFGPSGTCNAGLCSYPATETACAPAKCVNGVATAAAACVGGACQPATSTTCAYGCVGNMCAGDPCAGVACNVQQSATCVNATTRRTFAASGTCSGGTCSYASTDTACAANFTCAGGACSCTAESDATFCARVGATCGSKTAADNCRTSRTVPSCGTCTSPATCGGSGTANVCTDELTATTASLTGAGLSDCGVSSSDVCARSPLVSGGTFYRGTDLAKPATVSDFRLDKYEVTVGRFRKFVDAWVAGWRPATGSGKHTHLNSGSGLTNTAGGNEPGWDAAWANYPGAMGWVNFPGTGSGSVPSGTSPTTVAGWTTNLRCDSNFQTWTSAAGANEKRPQNCLSWYDLHAFCIWDGGFLPSEAEWEYAAAGGAEERTYPWGATVPSANASLSVYGCYWNGTGSCTGVTNIAPVGSVAAGNGKWGQSDLAGNVWEWNLDWHNSFAASCNNCANVTASSNRVIRGGSFGDFNYIDFVDYGASYLPAANRDSRPLVATQNAARTYRVAGRCARIP